MTPDEAERAGLLVAECVEDDRMTWRTIDSAPKDGTWILLFAPATKYAADVDRYFIATWESTDYNSESEWAYGPNSYEHRFRTGIYDGVTHWQPLPEPPAP